MKPLMLLSYLLILPLDAAAASKVLQQIRVDLDGDGRADRVSRVGFDHGGDQLVLQLSKSGKVLRFANWLANPEELRRVHPPCGYYPNDNLAVGPGGTFEWAQVLGDLDACAKESSTTYRFAWDGNSLVVRMVRRFSATRSAGDPSYRFWSEADYLTCKERSASWERHSAEPAPTEVDLGSGCTFPLSKIGQ
jgi:hypothetical protein